MFRKLLIKLESAGLIEEEDDINIVEESFRQAYRNSQADTIRVPGLQEFAGSVSTRSNALIAAAALLLCWACIKVASDAIT